MGHTFVWNWDMLVRPIYHSNLLHMLHSNPSYILHSSQLSFKQDHQRWRYITVDFRNINGYKWPHGMIEQRDWNEQQNIIDWINHIGRIVKNMLPVMSKVRQIIFPWVIFHNWVIFCTFVGILGTFGAFWGTIVTHWGNLRHCWGKLLHFWCNLGHFWGDWGQFGALFGTLGHFWGNLEHFCGNLWHFRGTFGGIWGTFVGNWGNLGYFWGNFLNFWGN